MISQLVYILAWSSASIAVAIISMTQSYRAKRIGDAYIDQLQQAEFKARAEADRVERLRLLSRANSQQVKESANPTNSEPTRTAATKKPVRKRKKKEPPVKANLSPDDSYFNDARQE